MPSLIGLRSELMRGDLRALYLGWLAVRSPRTRRAYRGGYGSYRDFDNEENWEDETVEPGVGRDGEVEPPVPPGLRTLSAPLRSLADFLRIDEEFLDVAAEASAPLDATTPTAEELARWVAGLPAAEKDAYLARFVAEEGDVPLRIELARRYREETSPRSKRERRKGRDGRRTLGAAAGGPRRAGRRAGAEGRRGRGPGRGPPGPRGRRRAVTVPRRAGPPRAGRLGRGRRR